MGFVYEHIGGTLCIWTAFPLKASVIEKFLVIKVSGGDRYTPGTDFGSNGLRCANKYKAEFVIYFNNYLKWN